MQVSADDGGAASAEIGGDKMAKKGCGCKTPPKGPKKVPVKRHVRRAPRKNCKK